MIKLKNIISRTIKNIGKLFTFALLIIPSFAICCLLGSWTIDNNGNLIGDNLANLENDELNQQGINFKIINQEVIAQGTTTGNNWLGILNLSNYNNNTNIYNELYVEIFGITQSKLILEITYNDNSKAWQTYDNNTSRHFNSSNIKSFYFYLQLTTLNENINIRFRMYIGISQVEKWEPYGVYYSSENYYNLQETYEQALQGTQIDYTNYTIQLINYPTSQTTDSYTIVGQLNTREYINEQGFLDVKKITELQNFGNTFDAIAVTSTAQLNTYNYNLLFNGSGNPNLDFALKYEYYGEEKFIVMQLMNIVGDSTYYGYFDLINLFGKNNINENIQNIVYKKFIIHWTGNPQPNDLVNIKLNSTDGYNMGYAKGVQDNLINLEELNETIEEQTRQLQEKQKQYETLLEHYNNAQIDNPLSQMVISVADIPLNLFHNMFNFDIMGFNLSAFILGIITILLVAYVIKLFL